MDTCGNTKKNLVKLEKIIKEKIKSIATDKPTKILLRNGAVFWDMTPCCFVVIHHDETLRYLTTLRHIPKDSSLHRYCRENVES